MMNGHTWQTKFSHSFTFWARRPNQPDKSNSSFPFTVNREPSNRGVIIPFFVLKCLSSYIQHTDFRVRVCVCVRTFTNCQKYRNRPSTALIENNAKIQVCGVCVCGRERASLCACQYTVDFSTFQESTLYCSDYFFVLFIIDSIETD